MTSKQEKVFMTICAVKSMWHLSVWANLVKAMPV